MLWNVQGHLEITFQMPPISTSTSRILVSGLLRWSTKQGKFVCINLDLIAEFHEMVNCVDVLRLFSYFASEGSTKKLVLGCTLYEV
jgi:hypothetical protein